MTTDIEELLREGIDRLAAGASVPAGLADRARIRNNRRRRMALGTAATAGTVVVAAAAAVLVATAGTGPPRRGPVAAPAQAQTVAYLAARTGQALAAAQRGDAVEQVRTGGRDWAAQPGSRAGKAAPQMMSWYYRGQARWEGFTAGGSPLFDGNLTAIRPASGGQRWAGHLVDYQAKTWLHGLATHGPDGPATDPSCSTFMPGLFAGADEAAQIREALACRQLKTAGTQQVDGVQATKLVSVRPLQDDMSGLHGLRFTLFVDPATYLPVRTSWTWAAQPGEQGIIRSDFRWLPPTQVNRSALTVMVPAGFREVHLSARDLGLQNAFIPVFGAGSYAP